MKTPNIYARHARCRGFAVREDDSPPYLTVQQFAARHGVSPATARLWCVTGLLPGAQKLGRDWIIPGDAARPVDGRTIRHQRAG